MEIQDVIIIIILFTNRTGSKNNYSVDRSTQQMLSNDALHVMETIRFLKEIFFDI